MMELCVVILQCHDGYPYIPKMNSGSSDHIAGFGYPDENISRLLRSHVLETMFVIQYVRAWMLLN